MQERRKSIANAVELRLSSTNSSIHNMSTSSSVTDVNNCVHGDKKMHLLPGMFLQTI